jgi:hypothetical protein
MYLPHFRRASLHDLPNPCKNCRQVSLPSVTSVSDCADILISLEVDFTGRVLNGKLSRMRNRPNYSTNLHSVIGAKVTA